jgi:fatty-acyl-CoA synthase
VYRFADVAASGTSGRARCPEEAAMLSTMMSYPLTTNHVLERAGTLFGDRVVAWRRPDKTVVRHTYADMRRRARALAAALVAAGIGRGDRVATLMWNNGPHLEAYFGIPAAGAVLHTLNLRLAPEDIAYIVNDAEDRIVILDDVLLPLWEKIRPHVNVERVLVAGAGSLPNWAESYEAFIAGRGADYVYPDLDEHAACGMCYTSGTTGRPKGVVYGHRSTVLHSLTIAIPDCLGLSVNDAVLAVTPMFHANSWGVPYAAAMMGANQVFPGPHLGAEDLLDLMAEERITLALGVPTIWMMIQQALDAAPARWPLVKGMRMMVGGSAVPPAMIRAFDRHGLTIKHGWGMTETSPVGSLAWLKPQHADAGYDAQVSVRAKQGIPLPLVEMRIVGDAGEQSHDGKSAGELQVRGPWITGSYFKVGAQPDKFTADGWLRTEDVATLDAEGYMRIADRTKDLIKSGGEWISSVDLENAVMGHPAVAEAAVIAVAHPKWDERPLAVVVAKPGQHVSAEALREHLLAQFPKWMVPDDYAFVDALPKTSTGKFLKTKLREDFRGYRAKG